MPVGPISISPTKRFVVRDYDRVRQILADGLGYMRDRDLDSWTMYALTERARAHLEQGLWREAAGDASAVLGGAPAAISRLVAAVVLGCVRMRQGDPEAGPLLDDARERAWATGDIMRIGPVAAARAEAAWLEGDKERTRDEVAEAYALALRHPEPWRLGELGLWLWRAGALDRPPRAWPCLTGWRSVATGRGPPTSGDGSAAPTRRPWPSPTATGRRSCRRSTS